MITVALLSSASMPKRRIHKATVTSIRVKPLFLRTGAIVHYPHKCLYLRYQNAVIRRADRVGCRYCCSSIGALQYDSVSVQLPCESILIEIDLIITWRTLNQ